MAPSLPRPVRAFLRPAVTGLTYARLLHLLMVCAWPALLIFITGGPGWALCWAAVTVALAALVPALRTAEGLQARFLLVREEPGAARQAVVAAPSASWADRGRLALWLELRLLVGGSTALLFFNLPTFAEDLVSGGDTGLIATPDAAGGPWWLLPAALVLLVLYGVVVAGGHLMAALACALLGPSRQERLAELEARTEQLLERGRIAAELHDSIGHALTVAVVQAGAARASGDAEFTGRALAAIEETGRAALEDLERVLRVLRQPETAAHARPSLDEAERLLDSARGSGAEVDVEVSGPVAALPGPVSREGYRMLQESLTNVLRHAGPVPVRVRIAVSGELLALEVSNPLPHGVLPFPGGGSGLRGIRERAALLGGAARAGAREGRWRVEVSLPLG